jgi:hypothetical protein
MSSSRVASLARRVSLLGCTVFVAAVFASAQSSGPDQALSNAAGYSSSQDGLSASGLQLTTYALPAASEPGGSAGGQYGNNRGYGGGQKSGLFHNWTFEAGGGFGAPFGNDTPYITWGGNFTIGGGLRFSNRLSALLEYQFMDNKLPGAFIAAASNANGGGITGGNAHINSITGSPVIDLFPKKSNGIYAVGGFGFYHKSTNFSAPESQFDPFYGYYYANVTVASFTSNQWGGNLGLGIYHRMGGMYGDSHTQLFAEARYTFLHTPAITQSNGLGTTELIPVTLGVRF